MWFFEISPEIAQGLTLSANTTRKGEKRAAKLVFIWRADEIRTPGRLVRSLRLSVET